MAKTTSKDIKYIDRDFDSIKSGLIEFAKNYYPNTYNDFNEASPGSMFLDIAAYVGDSLNYYIDSQFKENLVLEATERRNLLSIANAFGYKPKLSIPSQVDLDIYQLVPASGSGVSVQPNYTYALRIDTGMEAVSTTGTKFIVQDVVDFSIDNYLSPREVSVYNIDNTGTPIYYLLKKQAKAISAESKTATFNIGQVQRYLKLSLPNTDGNLIGITNVVDSDGNTWYEVPYLAQDTIFESVENTAFNDPDSAVYSSEVPFLLKLKRVPRRFVTRVTETGLELQFGAGLNGTIADEELLATPENVGLNLPTGKVDTDASLDPANPLITGTYGLAPNNTTLTVTYLVGGGIGSNVPSNTITQLGAITTNASNLPSNTTVLNTAVANSIAVNNAVAAVGGRSSETLEEIRQNVLAQFSSQQRAVTREDYTIRAYSMPSLYGDIAKVFVTSDDANNIIDSGNVIRNPFALNMYVLGYNNNKNLTTLNPAIKENLKTYIDQYRMLTDSVNIRDGYIVNIGVDFSIIALPNTNANEVLAQAIQALKDYFSIDKWQINQPIIYSDMFSALLKVRGVQTVTEIKVKNLNNEALGYSNTNYNIDAATKSGIIYPSLDPCIFEVKYPNNDIRGKIVTY